VWGAPGDAFMSRSSGCVLQASSGLSLPNLCSPNRHRRRSPEKHAAGAPLGIVPPAGVLYVCVPVCVCACVCAHVCTCARVCACVGAGPRGEGGNSMPQAGAHPGMLSMLATGPSKARGGDVPTWALALWAHKMRWCDAVVTTH